MVPKKVVRDQFGDLKKEGKKSLSNRWTDRYIVSTHFR